MRFYLYCGNLFLIFSLIVQQGLAQAQQVTFNLVEGINGISLGKVTGITQDPQGYMWFADQIKRCITRFDGYQMVSYRNDPSNPNSLGGTYPECIWADSSGVIWIGFFGYGLDRFDPKTNTFTHYRHNPLDESSLINDTVTTVMVDHQGIIWVGTYGGLERLNPKSGKFTHYRHQPKDNKTLSNNRIRALYEDRQGTLWIGTSSPFNLSMPNEGGLNRFNKEEGSFTRYLHDPKNPHSLINNKVRAIFEDSRGTFWVGTAGDGLHTMDRAKGTFKRHSYNSARPGQLSRPPVKQNNINDHITFIAEDGAGAIWIGTFQEGLTRYDPVTQQITHYNQNVNTASGFKDNSGWTSFTSRDGILWLSTQMNNLYRASPFKVAIPHKKVGNSDSLGNGVSAFQEEAPGVLWIGSGKGLFRQDKNIKNNRHFLHNPINPASISNDSIFSLYKDRAGTLWVGTINGLNRFNSQKGTFTRYQHNPKNKGSISNGAILSLLEDHVGGFWVATEHGLSQMNRNTGLFKNFKHDPKDPSSLSKDYVTAIAEDKASNLWIGTLLRGGLNQLDLQSGKFKHYLRGFNIISICIATDGTIWVGTDNGLYRRQPNANNFTHYIDPVTDIGSAYIAGIMEDRKNNLWISTYSGIIKINPQRNESSVFDKRYGVNTNTLRPFTLYITNLGEVLIGNKRGYYYFDPEKITTNTKPPEVLITNFKIADQLVKPTAESPLQLPLKQTTVIELKHNQNTFSFNFVGIHYSNPDKNQHLYMLEGYDNTWREAGSDKTAYYFNLPSGHYKFRVKVASSNGIWAGKFVRLHISPPWWFTWQAFGFYILLFAGSLWAFIQYRSHQLRMEKRQLELQINIRTAEVLQQKEEIALQRDQLEDTLQELQSTQDQLVQREKMASLGELTAGIAHEIQNPLNFVNNFSEVSVELLEEMESELISGDKEEAIAIATDVKQNLQKIIHHGKRADAIVKGMLQHSRANTGTKESTDINALAEEYLRLSYHGLRAKDKAFYANLKTDFDISIGKVAVVPQELCRVLLNLFNNAFYATQHKKNQLNGRYQPEVGITTKLLDGNVEIKIRDNGNGIPENIQQKIFQPFFTTKPTGQGTGLGLSLSYDIITKSHGGELRVNSQVEEFTEFTIVLPIKMK